MSYYDGDTFERGGRRFKVEHPYDDSGRVPWEDDDGAGIVTDWRHTYDTDDELEKDGEYRVLCHDHSSVRLYDWEATIKKATKDGWGLTDEDKAKLKHRLGVKRLTRKRVIEEAVERDYIRMREWCNEQWSYVGVVVTLVDDDDEKLGECNSLWSIESDCGDYLREVAHDLADEINHRLDATMAADIEASRPDMYHDQLKP